MTTYDDGGETEIMLEPPVIEPRLYAVLRRNVRSLAAILGANVVLLTVGAWALAGEEPEPIVEALADPTMLARLDDARAFLTAEEKKRALDLYSEVARQDVELFTVADLDAVVSFLSAPNRHTRTAETILVTAGARSIGPLREAWTDPELSRYHRRRVGEVLDRLGEPVDLVPLWIETLESDRCEARSFAAHALGELRDLRALPHLDRLADEGGWSDCGSEAARAAAARIRS